MTTTNTDARALAEEALRRCNGSPPDLSGTDPEYINGDALAAIIARAHLAALAEIDRLRANAPTGPDARPMLGEWTPETLDEWPARSIAVASKHNPVVIAKDDEWEVCRADGTTIVRAKARDVATAKAAADAAARQWYRLPGDAPANVQTPSKVMDATANDDRTRAHILASRITGLIVDSGLPSREPAEVEAWLVGGGEAVRRDVEADLLRDVLPYIEPCVEEQQSYGYFLSHFVDGDPRAFSPDPECSTEEERAQHRADCEAWDRGERPVHSVMQAIDPERSIAKQVKGADSAVLVRDAEGNVTGGHVHRAGYGLGVTTFRDEEAVALLARITARLAGTTTTTTTTTESP